MKLRIAFAATAALALAACGGGDKPAGDASASPAASSAVPASSAAAAAAPAAGAKPTREFVVGNWGTDGNCEMAMNLKADGSSDGPFGNWTYADGAIGFADAPEMKIEVTVIDDKTMQSKNSGGGSHKMTRCP